MLMARSYKKWKHNEQYEKLYIANFIITLNGTNPPPKKSIRTAREDVAKHYGISPRAMGSAAYGTYD